VNRVVRILAALLALVTCPIAAAEDRALVLVVRSDSPIESIDSIELRKLYLGISVRRNGRTLQPLLNRTSLRLEQIFLQNIVAMSEASYERRVLQMAVKFGRPTPRAFTKPEELRTALLADSHAVTYMWSDETGPELRALRILWRE
jgi:hypothetical protein